MSKKAKQIKQENPGNLYILPIAFILTVVPLIVFMKAIKLTPIEITNWYGEPNYPDFFNYYKSQWLIVGTVIAAVFYLVYSIIKGFKLQKSILYIPTIFYAVFIILSTATSQNQQIALRGFVARYEGMWALLCYLALMVITYNLVKAESQIKFLLGALLISASVIGILGVFQFFSLDLFRSEFGKRLILPEAYQQISDSVNFRFEKTFIYSTLSNPNYIGSYMALAIPIALVAFLNVKKPALKIGAGLLMIILLISLFGSRSRAGLMGLVVSVLIALVLFRKGIFKRKLLSMIITASVVILFFGANFALNGVLTDRILLEFNQSDETQFFDLKDITFKDNTASIVSGTETLVIKIVEKSQLNFCDDAGNELKTTVEGADGNATISFTDPKYKDYILNIHGALITVNQKQVKFEIEAKEDGTFQFIGINGDKTNIIEKPEAIGFVGHERLGSARGYIWSRTLPMLKDVVFLGYGPDTYAIEFPQKDYIGKIRAYGTAQMLVDKPHNMYLQIAVNTGVISLLAVLVLLGIYIVQSFKLYIKKLENNLLQLSGVGIFIAICGYLTAGFFNDSVVAIAPIFWVLLGLGFVCNGLIRNQDKNIQQVNKRSAKS